MIRKVLLLLLPALMGVTMASAKTFNLDDKIPADPAVRIGKLDNGMTYYIRHNEKPVKQADFYIYHNVGAIQEEDHQDGLAHFLEHMAFNGTKNLPDQMLRNYLETIGVKFGADLNAMTSQDYTMYMVKSVPTIREGIIDTALLILHDWSHFIALEDEEIDNERGVILEELRQGRNAMRRIQEANSKVLYNNTKYAYRNVIGTEDGLKTFKYSDIKEFYNTWYRPGLQTVVIVGDIDVDDIEAKLKKMMADIPARQNPEPKVNYEDPGNKEPMFAIGIDPEMKGTNVGYLVKHKTVAREDRDKVSDWKRNNAINLINKMTSARLDDIRNQVNAPFVGANMAAFSEINALTHVFNITAVTRDGEAARGFEAVYTETERLRRFGFNKSELEVAKAQRLREVERAYDGRNDKRNNSYVQPYINNYTKNAPIPSAEVAWELDNFVLSTIDLDYVNALVRELTEPVNQVIILMGPDREGVHTPTEKEFLDIMTKVNASKLEPLPDTGGLKPLISKKIKGGKVVKTETGAFGSTVWTLSNGAKVVVNPTDYKTDEVLLKISAPGGLSLFGDEDVCSGAVLKAIVERSGVDQFGQTELKKQLAGKSADLKMNVDYYSNGFTGNSSSKDIETLLQLTHLYFTSPRITEDAYTVYMDGTRTALKGSMTDPSFILADSTDRILYGHNPRRYRITMANVDQIKYERLMPMYKKMYGNADDFTYIFTGDIKLDELKPLVEKYIGSLKTTKSDRKFIDDGARMLTGNVESKIAVAMRVPKSTVSFNFNGSADYSLKNKLSFDILRQIMIIRYTAVIREEKGGTYGVRVRANVSATPVPQYVIDVFFETSPERVDELAPIVVEELKAIAKQGPKQDDLTKIKEFMLKQRMDDLKKNDKLRDNLNTYYIYDADMTSNYEDIINNITVEDIRALAAKVVADGNVIRIVMDPK